MFGLFVRGGMASGTRDVDTSEESALEPGRERHNDVGGSLIGSLEVVVVSGGGTTAPVLGTGLNTCGGGGGGGGGKGEDKGKDKGTLEYSLTSDPDGLPGFTAKPVETGTPDPALTDLFNGCLQLSSI